MSRPHRDPNGSSPETRANPPGSPVDPDPDMETCQRVLDALCEGEGLYDICRSDDSLPTAGQFNQWMRRSPNLRRRYAHARASAGLLIGQQVESLARRVEAGLIDPRTADVAMRGYTWAASRMNREAWGDASRVEHSGPDGGPIQQASVQSDVQLGRAMLTSKGLRELAKAVAADLDDQEGAEAEK